MEDSYDSSSLSPTQLLDRLQVIRALQEVARDKLQRHRLPSHPGQPEGPLALHELLSHLSADSSSYRTFQRLLQDSDDALDSPLSKDLSRSRIRSADLIDGVSVLNLSQESEIVIASPTSGRSQSDNVQLQHSMFQKPNLNRNDPPMKSILKKHIELDEMPILSPQKDFETLLIEKIQVEKQNQVQIKKVVTADKIVAKKPFLRRGEGLSRFGLKKDDLVIQNTKSLPWKRKRLNSSCQTNATKQSSSPENKTLQTQDNIESSEQLQDVDRNKIEITDELLSKFKNVNPTCQSNASIPQTRNIVSETNYTKQPKTQLVSKYKKINTTCQSKASIPQTRNIVSETRDTTQPNPVPQTKTNKTWAAILTQEQDAFLQQLKQSSYYRNFDSPVKSVVSDTSCDDSLHRLRYERETAEQNMFELLENKVSNTSFCSESSFVNRFFNCKPNCSGDDTPMILQKCLANNPQLLQLFPAPKPNEVEEKCSNREENPVDDSCESHYSDCDHESCSSSESCSTCHTVEESSNSLQNLTPQCNGGKKKENKQPDRQDKINSHIEKKNPTLDRTVTNAEEAMKTNMAEMNANLTATSELLKERLHELEDEIEMFKRENASLAKMREEIDVEKQRFFDERATFEQKFNEDKILSEYYLAEEKEKLAKQKQVYDRYIREMRGRLTKKEKDEVTKLKNEIEDLKEEHRNKDAKSTSCIARLRNQLKMLEKEKKDLYDECEKLKKENRRIQQVNTTTRRLSNIKYLSEINRKLSMIGSKDKMPMVSMDEDVKYKSNEIANRRKVTNNSSGMNRPLRARAKSVPNLTVTSRYAKYFSQRDAASQMEPDRVAGGDYDIDSGDDSSDIDYNTVKKYEKCQYSNFPKKYGFRCSDLNPNEESDSEVVANLEKIYLEKFKSNPQSTNHSMESGIDRLSARSNKSSSSAGQCTILGQNSPRNLHVRPERNMQSSANYHDSNRSKSPIPHLNLSKSESSCTINRSKSPVSILSNRSSNASRKSATIHDHLSPSSHEVSPVSSKTNEEGNSRSLTRTNLNPTEFKRPDGTRELRFPNGNVKVVSADGKSSKFMYYNGDIKETFYDEGRIKYFYAETNTYHTTHPDGLEVLQFPDGQVEKRYPDGSVEIRLPNGSMRYTDPRNAHVSEEWRFPDGAVLTLSRDGEKVVRFPNGQVEVHAKDHKRREFPDGTVKLLYSDGTSETRYASGRVRVKDSHGALIMDSALSK